MAKDNSPNGAIPKYEFIFETALLAENPYPCTVFFSHLRTSCQQLKMEEETAIEAGVSWGIAAAIAEGPRFEHSQTGTDMTMTANADSTSEVINRSDAALGLALVRLTIGAEFVWVFFENLRKGLYTPSGYSGLIQYYIKMSHSPAPWKAVMGFMASHSAMAAPLQGLTEISLGLLLIIGLLTRPAAFVAFLFLGSLWISEYGTSWIWELLVPVVASLGLAVGRAGRRWGIDAWLSQRWPTSPWW